MPTKEKDLVNLTKLGQKLESERVLEVFPNHSKNLVITCDCKEFTCYCPLTKQPDYARIIITYMPDEWIVESKSLDLYFKSFKNVEIFQEHLIEDIISDFVYFVRPKKVSIEIKFLNKKDNNIEISCKMQITNE